MNMFFFKLKEKEPEDHWEIAIRLSRPTDTGGCY